MLTGNDIFEAKLFEDRVSHGGWPVDVHPPEGLRSKDPPCDQTFLNELYSVPFSIMYSRNIKNLMLAGRCISVSHVAMGSIRVMNSLGAAAQAVGMAAALCIERKVDPREIREKHMAELQQGLLKEDVYIISLSNNDSKDLARQATVTTLSEASLPMENADGFVELAYDLAQQLPVSKGRLDRVSVLLKSDREDSRTVGIRLHYSKTLARFDNIEPVFQTDVTIEPGVERWFDLDVNHDLPDDALLWVSIEKQASIYWGYSNREAFATRFAARFNGLPEPKPSHGLARIAPVKDDWFPINHHGSGSAR